MNEHQPAWDLIPWAVNGTASPEQRQVLQAHLAVCEDCRGELARQQALRQTLLAPAALPGDAAAAERGLQQLFARLDDPLAGAPGAPGTTPRRPSAAPRVRWLVAAVVVQSLALSALAGAWLWRAGAPEYVTLGQPAALSAATIRIVPEPGLRLEELDRLLQPLNLQVVAGPSGAGAYDLAPLTAAQARERQLAALRAAPGLRLVEPLNPLEPLPPKGPLR